MSRTPKTANEAMSTRPVAGVDHSIIRHTVFKADENWGVEVGRLRTLGYEVLEDETNDYRCMLRAPGDISAKQKEMVEQSKSLLNSGTKHEDVTNTGSEEVEKVEDTGGDR